MKTYSYPFLGTLAVIAFSQAAQADTYNWIGGAGTWDTATANWTGFASTWPATSTTNDDAVFAGTPDIVTIAAGGVTANDLTFNADGYTLSGAGITLDGTTPTITTADATLTTISSALSGSVGLVKAGAGNLILSGTNNYTGTTAINAGILIAGNGAALGSNVDGTTVGANGALDVGGQSLGTEVVTISGAGPSGEGAIVNSGAQQIFALGRIVLAGDATIGGDVRWDLRNSTPTLDTAGFTLTKTGPNYLGLVGVTISTPGNVIVNQGELNLTFGSTFGGVAATNSITVNSTGTLGLYQTSNSHGSTLNLNNGSTLRGENGSGSQNTWTGPINVAGDVTLKADGILNLPANLTGTANLTKTGTGTAILSGTNSITSTALTINAGSLLANNATALTSAPSITVTSGSGGALVLGNNLSVGAGKTITIAGGGANSFYGALSAATGNTGTSEWQGAVTIGEATGTRVGSLGGILHISGDIGEANAGSTLTVRNDENVNATVILSGNNTFSGTLGLSASNLRIGSATALGSGPLLVDNGARPVSLSSTNTTARIVTGATTLNGSGTLTLGDATRNGKLTFSNTIALGTAARPLAVNSETEFAGPVSSGTGGGITKSGPGTLALSANNSYSGATIVNAGTLKLDYSTNGLGKLSDSAGLTLGGSTLELAGGTHTELVSATALAAGTTSTITRSSGGSMIQLNTITRNSASFVDFAQSGIATADNPNNSAGLLGTWATIGGTDWAINSTNGADGPITPPAYTLSSAAGNTAASYAAAHITVDSNQAPGAGIAPNSIRFNGPGPLTLTLQGANSIASGGILVTTGTGTTTSTLAGGTLTGPANGDLVIHQNNPDGNLVISSQIVNNTTTNVVKTGVGPATLSGDNTYTGSTVVSGGALTLSGNKTGNSGAITVSNQSGIDATLNISAGSYAVGGNNFIVGNAQGTPATGTVNQTGGVVSFSGGNGLLLGNAGTTASTGIYNLSAGSVNTGTAAANRGVMLGANQNSINIFNLSGTGFLNMTAATGGTATSVLQIGRFDASSGANNTTSTFNQSGGTANVAIFSVGGNGSSGSGLSSTVNWTSGIFVADSFPRLAAGNTNTATLTIGGNADVTLPKFPNVRGTNSTATVYFNGGTLRPLVAEPVYLAAPTNAFIKAGGARFDVAAGKDITVSQSLLGDPVSTGGGLTKDGAGTLALTGTNTYTGNTTVTAGTLSLGNGTANSGLADGADVSVAGSAVLNLNYSGTDTIDGLTLNGVAKAPGVWGSVASGAPNTDPLLTGSGTLTVTTGPSASAYETWASSFGLGGLNAGFEVDFEKDGLQNGLEFIFGGNPILNDVPSKAPIQTLDATDLILSFKRADASIAGITLTAEWDVDLAGSWTSVAITRTTDGNDTLANGVNVAVATNGSQPDDITVRIPRANAVDGKLFGRIRATQP
jgi:autotransporter-associated beta strand protein